MAYLIKFPVRVRLSDIKRVSKIPETPTISIFRQGDFGIIRVESWEELVKIFEDVSMGIHECLHMEITDEETGNRVEGDVLMVIHGLKPSWWNPKMGDIDS